MARQSRKTEPKTKATAKKRAPAKKSQATAARKRQTERKPQHPADTKTYWLDDKKNVRKIFWTLVAVCVALVASDAFYHKHVHYAFEGIFGFFGLFGFGLSFLLVLASKELRKILMRDEDYYDR